MNSQTQSMACPCGVGVYEQCCGRFIGGQAVAQTAEQLMRSRYSAYVLRNEAYLRASWYPRTCPEERLVAQDDGIKWLGLDVRRHEQNGDNAIVEFVARYKVGGRAHRMHEVSRFVREDAQWFYLDGSFPEKK